MDRVTGEGRIDSAVNGRCENGNAAGRVLTSRKPATRRRWSGAASGMLAAALEAVGAIQGVLGRNPSGGNGLDGRLAARALRSGRTSRTGFVQFLPGGTVQTRPEPPDCSYRLGLLSWCRPRWFKQSGDSTGPTVNRSNGRRPLTEGPTRAADHRALPLLPRRLRNPYATVGRYADRAHRGFGERA